MYKVTGKLNPHKGIQGQCKFCTLFLHIVSYPS